jgi:hypothetical protein
LAWKPNLHYCLLRMLFTLVWNKSSRN